MIENIVVYIKERTKIGDMFYGDAFKTIIRKYLSLELKTDWIGRQYGVLNPIVDIKGNLNIDNIIVELDGENTNNNEFVKTWLMKQLSLVGNLFKINGLYDYIDMDIKHVGPMNIDNYLIIFDITSRKLMTRSIKRFVTQSLIYACICGSILFMFF